MQKSLFQIYQTTIPIHTSFGALYISVVLLSLRSVGITAARFRVSSLTPHSTHSRLALWKGATLSLQGGYDLHHVRLIAWGTEGTLDMIHLSNTAS